MPVGGRRSWLVLFFPAALAGSLASPTARATVLPDRGELPPPTVVVLQAADVAALGPGVRARAGDYRLEYGTVAFLVARPGPGRREGGTLVDVVQLFPWPRRLGLGQLAPLVAGREPVWLDATVSRSQELAVVQVEGHDGADPHLKVRTQYQVGPALRTGDALRIVTTVQGGAGVQLELGDLLRWGELHRFVPGGGFAGPSSRALRLVEGLGPGGALLYLPGGGALGATSGGQVVERGGPGWSELVAPALRSGASVSYRRMLHVPTEPGRILCDREVVPGARVPVRGTVRDPAGEVPRAVVVLERPGGEALAATVADAQGRFSLCAPAPGTFHLRVEGAGRALSAPRPLQLGPAGVLDLDVLLPRPARLRVGLREGAGGRAAPGRLSIQPLDGVPGRAVASGELPAWLEGDLARIALPEGEADLTLPPGRYRVTASRGPFYELSAQEVALRAGEERRLQLTLRRGVPEADLQGIRCLALAVLPPGRETAAAARAEGLDLLLVEAGGRSEGDIATVAAVQAQAAGGGALLAFPLGGARAPAPLQAATPAALAEALRRLPGEGGEPPLVVGDAAAAGVQLDAVALWSGPTPSAAALRAWLEQMDRSWPVPAVTGVPLRSPPLLAGSPRTCFAAPSAGGLRSAGAQLRAALRRGDLVLTNGPWLQVRANGASPGQVAAAPDGQVTVAVTVLAAGFVDVRELEVWVGSRRAAAVPVPPTGTALRYRGALRVTVDRDAPLVVVVRGNRPLGPLQPGAAPLALTSPVLVDRDGDGRYRQAAPGTLEGGLQLPRPPRPDSP
ncbi:MAG: carboxypeptidase regulatory-like domain-containing protein [Myxococcota bacterium]|nr:carboxypeptidase regulatory-like domain-containing protein [Myxococcota bacterium]